MTLYNATEGKDYVIKGINTDDSELEGFLFTLGCYTGERVGLVSRTKSNCIVRFKDSRYSIDNRLSKSITILNQ